MSGVNGKNGRNISKQQVVETNFPSAGFKSVRALHASFAGQTVIDLTNLNPPAIALANGYVPPTASDLQKVSMLRFKQNVMVNNDAENLVQDVDFVITGARTLRLNSPAISNRFYEIIINAEPRTGTPLADARPITVTGVLLLGTTDFNVGSPFEVGKYINSQVGAVSVHADGVLLKRNPGNQPGGTGDYYEVHAGTGLGTIIRFNSSTGSDRDICVLSVGSLVERPDGSQDALIDNLAGQIDAVRGEVEAQHGIVIPIGSPNNIDLKAFGDRVLLLEQSGGGGAHIIEDEGVILPPRTSLNFEGAGVTASDSGGKTVVTIPGGAGSSYSTIEEEGVAVTQRTTLDFQGAGVTATDDGANTVVTVPGGAVDSVNGVTGVVILDTDDVSEGATNNYANTAGGQSDITGNTNVSLNTTHRGLTAGNPHSITQTEVGLSNVTNDAQIPLSQKGAANGVAELDASSRIPAAQLPSSAMEYQGAWNANTNTPPLADGVGDTGDLYRASVTGTQNLGSGNIAVTLGDAIIYNGTIWERIPADDLVSSVNGQLGIVVLDPDDLDDTSTTNKFTTAGDVAKLAGIEASATGDQTDAEIETGYNNQVGVVSQVDAEAGVATTVERWTPERVGQAVSALGGGGYDTVEEEGVALPQRTTIDFQGAGVTATDDGANTVVTIPGGGVGGFDVITSPATEFQEYDEFISSDGSTLIGKLSWSRSVIGGGFAASIANGGIPGNYQIGNGFNVGGRASIAFNANGGPVNPATDFDLLFIVSLVDSTSNIIFRCGISNTPTIESTISNGIYFQKSTNDTTWRFVTESSSVLTIVDSGIPITVGTLQRLRVRRSGVGTISFSVDGGVETDITTNITTSPSLLVGLGTQGFIAANRRVNIDYFGLKITGLTR